MKLIITSFLVFCITFLHAQSNLATPNAGFEYWTHFTASGGYDDPDSSWSCLNPTTAALGVITCFKDSTDPHSGRYDAHLVTQEVVIEVAPGALTTGTINTSTQTISGGLPYTLRPDSIIGWYRYTSVSGDNGDCEFYLFGATHADTIGQAFFKTPTSTVSAWTRFSLAVTYSSSAIPDTALWIFSSSLNQPSAQIGSQLYIDDIGLIFDSTTGIYTLNNSQDITVGPNPTTGLVSINNNSNSKSLLFSLFDVTGRKMKEEKLTSGTNYMQLDGMAEAVYIYTIQDDQSSVIKTGKIVVQK